MTSKTTTFLALLLAVAAGAAQAQWEVRAFGSGTVANAFDVRVGDARNDGTNRVYISERNGRVIEWTYSATGWSGSVVPGLVTNLALLEIASVRGDGSNRLYYTEFNVKGALHEARWAGAGWTTSVVDRTYQSLCLFSGAGRNDGVQRLYVGTRGDAAHTDQGLWEYTCVTGSWSRLRLHPAAMEGRGAVGDLHNDGTNRVLANTSNLSEYAWAGTNYAMAWVDRSTNMAPDPTCVGKVRNDGRTRVLINGAQGRVEYAYSAGAWAKTIVDATKQRGDVQLARLWADGLYRLYSTFSASTPKGPVREYTWAAGAYTNRIVVDGVTGATAMLAAGNGRNDGVARLYAPDYSGARILEITSTNPYVYATPRTDLAVAAVSAASGRPRLELTNLTDACEYAIERTVNLGAGWSNAAVITAAGGVTNWADPSPAGGAFYRVRGRPEP